MDLWSCRCGLGEYRKELSSERIGDHDTDEVTLCVDPISKQSLVIDETCRGLAHVSWRCYHPCGPLLLWLLRLWCWSGPRGWCRWLVAVVVVHFRSSALLFRSRRRSGVGQCIQEGFGCRLRTPASYSGPREGPRLAHRGQPREGCVVPASSALPKSTKAISDTSIWYGLLRLLALLSCSSHCWNWPRSASPNLEEKNAMEYMHNVKRFKGGKDFNQRSRPSRGGSMTSIDYRDWAS
mmetsp:Transcript_16372/g.35790  ORF Transcript_16372/g.35790 Transcript_16372/m.35790 type:complete len:237 (-) Transcript_16372:27-737(-)